MVVLRKIGNSVPVGVINSVLGVGPVIFSVFVELGTIVIRRIGGPVPVGVIYSVPGIGPVAYKVIGGTGLVVVLFNPVGNGGEGVEIRLIGRLVIRTIGSPVPVVMYFVPGVGPVVYSVIG